MRFASAALGASRPPAAALAAPGRGPAVDLAVDTAAHLALDLASDVGRRVRALAGRWVRLWARQVATMVRTRGPALVALLVRHRPWVGPAHLVVGAGARLPRAAGDALAEAVRIPTRRPSSPPASPGGDGPRPGDPEGGPGHHEVLLPADSTAPGLARALLQDVVPSDDADDDLYQDAAMVVTELVANAVDHARTPSTLTLELDERSLRIAVRDARPCGPLRALPLDPTAPRGRGLQMVEALATSWGVTQDADGKTVWATLPRA